MSSLTVSPGGPPVSEPGYPGGVLVQLFVNQIGDQVARYNGFQIANYHGRLQFWNSNNSRGIYQGAPAGVTIEIFHPDVAAALENGDFSQQSAMITTTDYWEIQPGLTLAPAPPAPELPQPANPVGQLASPAVPDLYLPAPGDKLPVNSIYPPEPLPGQIQYRKIAAFGAAVYWTPVR